jgi:cell division protein FtsI/penicillin-binding protein 2
VGFAPRDNPQIALAVTVEYVEGGGGKNAGPIGLEIIRLCKKMGYIR